MIGGFELPTGGPHPAARPRRHRRTRRTSARSTWSSRATRCSRTSTSATTSRSGCKRKKVAKAEITRRVGEALELVHLAGYERRKPNQLSGGQQQRVALARALVNRPNVLLLDEPLGALDLKLRRRLQVELKRIQVEVGITFVYVTHDQEEALTMSDRIAVMHAGQVEQLGTPEELYDRPTTRFVADFIGTTNLLRGRVEADGRVRLTSGEIAPVRRTTGSPPGTDGGAQRPPRSRSPSSRPAPMGAIRGHGRAGRVPRQHRLLPGHARPAGST